MSSPKRRKSSRPKQPTDRYTPFNDISSNATEHNSTRNKSSVIVKKFVEKIKKKARKSSHAASTSKVSLPSTETIETESNSNAVSNKKSRRRRTQKNSESVVSTKANTSRENWPGPPMPAPGNYTIDISEQFEELPKMHIGMTIGRMPAQLVSNGLRDWSRKRPLAPHQCDTRIKMTTKELKAMHDYENKENECLGYNTTQLEEQLGHPCPFVKRKISIVEVEESDEAPSVLTTGEDHTFDIVVSEESRKRLIKNATFAVSGKGNKGTLFEESGENFGLYIEFITLYPNWMDQTSDIADKFLEKRGKEIGHPLEITGSDVIKKLTTCRSRGLHGLRKLTELETFFISGGVKFTKLHGVEKIEDWDKHRLVLIEEIIKFLDYFKKDGPKWSDHELVVNRNLANDDAFEKVFLRLHPESRDPIFNCILSKGKKVTFLKERITILVRISKRHGLEYWKLLLSFWKRRVSISTTEMDNVTTIASEALSPSPNATSEALLPSPNAAPVTSSTGTDFVPSVQYIVSSGKTSRKTNWLLEENFRILHADVSAYIHNGDSMKKSNHTFFVCRKTLPKYVNIFKEIMKKKKLRSIDHVTRAMILERKGKGMAVTWNDIHVEGNTVKKILDRPINSYNRADLQKMCGTLGVFSPQCTSIKKIIAVLVRGKQEFKKRTKTDPDIETTDNVTSAIATTSVDESMKISKKSSSTSSSKNSSFKTITATSKTSTTRKREHTSTFVSKKKAKKTILDNSDEEFVEDSSAESYFDEDKMLEDD